MPYTAQQITKVTINAILQHFPYFYVINEVRDFYCIKMYKASTIGLNCINIK